MARPIPRSGLVGLLHSVTYPLDLYVAQRPGLALDPPSGLGMRLAVPRRRQSPYRRIAVRRHADECRDNTRLVSPCLDPCTKSAITHASNPQTTWTTRLAP